MGTLKNPNRLTSAQSYQLRKALEDQDTQEMITQRRLSQKAAADLLSPKLGFPLTGAQIELAAKDVGFTLPRQYKEGGLSPRIQELQSQISELQNANITLAKTVNAQGAEIAHLRKLMYHIYYEENLKPPPGYTLPPKGSNTLVSTPPQERTTA